MKRTNKLYIYKEKLEKRDYIACIETINNFMFNIASFKTIEQLEKFKNLLGFDYELQEIVNEGLKNEVKIYNLDYTIVDDFTGGFWKLEYIPKNAIKFKALSNGSIVDCYFKKDKRKNEIRIYRPNPNAKEVYKPLTTDEHIEFQKLYGTY